MLRLKRYIVSSLVVCAGGAVAAQSGDDKVVAQIGDHAIRASELETWWQAHDPGSFAQNRDRVHAAHKRALNALISDYLLAPEAKKNGVTEEELLSQEISKRVEPVVDEEVQRMYEDFRSLLSPGSSFEKVKPSLVRRLQLDKLRTAEARYLEGLWRAFEPNAIIDLDIPRRIFVANPRENRS